MDASIDKDCGARAGHVEDMLPGFRPHPLGGRVPRTPSLFETSKGEGYPVVSKTRLRYDARGAGQQPLLRSKRRHLTPNQS